MRKAAAGQVCPGQPAPYGRREVQPRAGHHVPGRGEHRAAQVQVPVDQPEHGGQALAAVVVGVDQQPLATQQLGDVVGVRGGQQPDHLLGHGGERDVARYPQQRQPPLAAGVHEVARDPGTVGVPGGQGGHPGGDQGRHEPRRIRRRPPPDHAGEDQLPAGQVPPRIRQVGGDHPA